MKTSKELRELLAEKNNAIEALERGWEGKDPSKEDREAYQAAIEERNGVKSDLDFAIQKEAEAAARAAAGQAVQGLNKEERKAIDDFSIFRAISSIKRRDKLEGLEAEFAQEARNEGFDFEGIAIPSKYMEMRTDVDQATSAIAPKQVLAFVDAIRQDPIHRRVGCTVLEGLTTDYQIPIVTAQTLAWATAENSAAADGGSNFTSKTLSPVRLTGYVDLSNKILLQNGPSAESALMRDLGREVGAKIDAAMFSTSSVTNAPGSIAATSGVGTFTEAATYAANSSIYADFVSAESTLATASALNADCAYVGHPKLMADIKRSAHVASVNAGATGQRGYEMLANGYRTHFTNACTSNGTTSADFIFGDFSKVYLGFFGGVGIEVDPYSVKLNDQIRLIVHRYVDWDLVQGAAFVKATSLLS